MKLSLMVAKAENGVIGNEGEMPWKVEGEQLLFKAMTFNQWLLVGRKTFESMGILPNRKYAVVSRSDFGCDDPNVRVFSSIETALKEMAPITDHLIVAGGGQIYRALIDQVETVHLSTIHAKFDGDVTFPELPPQFQRVFEQSFESNIDYTYQIWEKT